MATEQWEASEIDRVLKGIACTWASRAHAPEARVTEFSVTFLDEMPGDTIADAMGCAAFGHDDDGAYFQFARRPIVKAAGAAGLLLKLLKLGAHEGQHAVQFDRGEEHTSGSPDLLGEDASTDTLVDAWLERYEALPTEVEARDAERCVEEAWGELQQRLAGSAPREHTEEVERMIALLDPSRKISLFRSIRRATLSQG